jgi:hypothetical protein
MVREHRRDAPGTRAKTVGEDEATGDDSLDRFDWSCASQGCSWNRTKTVGEGEGSGVGFVSIRLRSSSEEQATQSTEIA